MKIVNEISLPHKAAEVLAMQQELAWRVTLTAGATQPRLVAAADVAYEENALAHAAVVVLDTRDFSIVDRATWSGVPPYPYVPGLFVLREASCLLEAFKGIATVPDAILIDGHGTAHPRRFGLACYIGLSLDVPTVGCAKTHLFGDYDPVGLQRGALSPIKDGSSVIGKVVRTQVNVNPVYVSAGHRYDQDTAATFVLAVTPSFRIPEPQRQAHLLSNETRARSTGSGTPSAAP